MALPAAGAGRGARDERKRMPGVEQPPPRTGSGIQQVGPGTWEITQDEATGAVASMPFVAKQLWVRKVHVRGMFVGYKLKNIRKGSLVERAGFKNNDIIFRINGTTLKEPLSLLIRLLDAKRAVVEIERKGKTHKQTYLFVERLSKAKNRAGNAGPSEKKR